MTCRDIAGFDLRAGHDARPVGRSLSWWASQAVSLLLRWQELARQRRSLGQLSDHMLQDIGVSRADALREATRQFWDAADKTGTGR